MNAARRMAGLFLALFLTFSASAANPPALTMSITSPANGFATNQASLNVVVAYSAKQGNVQDIDLLKNGTLIQTFTNKPRTKTGTHAFAVSLTTLAEGTYQFQARAFQGNRKANQFVLSTPISVIVDRTAPQITNLVPAEGATLDTPRPTMSASFSDALSGVKVSTIHITLDNVDKTAQATVSATGFSFTPSADLADGNHTLIVSLADNAGNPATATRHFTISSLPPITNQTGYITGVLYNASTDAPLEGVKVFLKDVPGAVFTNAQGKYAFPAPASGPALLQVTKPSYHYANRTVEVVSTRETGVPPIYMVPVESTTHLTAAAGGVATAHNGDLTVTFPPGALPQDADVTLSLIMQERDLPGPSPEGDILIAAFFGEPTVVFNVPVHVRMKLLTPLPAGTQFPIAFWDRVNQKWVGGPMATVSADGQFIEGDWARFSSGGTWGRNIRRVGQGGGNPNQPATTEKSDTDAAVGDPAGFFTDYKGGNVKLEHSLPPVRRLGADRTVGLSYRSDTANPDPVIGAFANLDTNTTIVPLSSTFEAEVAGTYTQITRQAVAGGTAERLHLGGTGGQGLPLATGAYPVRMKLANNYSGTIGTTTTYGGAVVTDTGIPTRPRPVTEAMNSRVIIENNAQSPYGKGWDITGLQRLYPQPDGSALVTEGGKGATIFDPAFVEAPSAFASYNRTALGSIDPNTIVTNMAMTGDLLAVAINHTQTLNDTIRFMRVVLKDATSTRWDVTVDRVEFMHQGSLAFTPDGTKLYAVVNRFVSGNSGDNRPEILEFDVATGAVTNIFNGPLNGSRFAGMAVDPQGRVYTHSENPNDKAIYRLNRTTSQLEAIAPRLPDHVAGIGGYVDGMGIDRYGRIYVAMHSLDRKHRLYRVTEGGVPEEILSLDQSRQGRSQDIRHLTVAPDGTCYFSGSVAATPSGMGTVLTEVFRVTPQGIMHRVLRSVATGNPQTGPFPMNVIGVATDGTLIVSKIIYTPFPSTDSQIRLYHTFAGRVFTSPGGERSELTRETDGSYRRRMLDGTVVAFNVDGFQTSVTDRHNLATTYAYNSGMLSSVTDPTGAIWSLSYMGGHLSQIQDPAGRATQFTQDGSGQLTQITQPDGTHRNFSYDLQGRATSSVDENGAALSFSWANGRLSTVTFPPRTQVSVDANGIATQTTASEVRHFQPSDLIGLYTPGVGTPANPAPATMTDSVNAGFTDGSGNASNFKTDSRGQATEIVDALGRTTKFDRNGNGDVIHMVRANGTQTFTFYDLDNARLFTDLDLVRFLDVSRGAQTTLEYTVDFHQVSRAVDFRGNPTVLGYSLQGDPTTITDAANHSTTLTYTAEGLPDTVQDALNGQTHFEYDPVTKNLVRITNPLGKVTTLHYYRARYYDPDTGRFIGEDPFQPFSHENLYSYVRNHPTRLVDPFGLIPNEFDLAESLQRRGQALSALQHLDGAGERLAGGYVVAGIVAETLITGPGGAGKAFELRSLSELASTFKNASRAELRGEVVKELIGRGRAGGEAGKEALELANELRKSIGQAPLIK